MKIVLPFENSSNKCHYISDSQFAVYNQNCYITPSGLSANMDSAEIFLGYKNVDKKHDSIVVFNEKGEFLIDRNGRKAGPYDFIGEACTEGFRPVKKHEEKAIKWGYLPPKINPEKNPKFLTSKNDAFFLATRVAGYGVYGYEGNEYLRLSSSKKIVGILHSEFKALTNVFFVGISKNLRGKELQTIYRTNKIENEFGQQSLKRPYNSPHSYIEVTYKDYGRFEVLHSNGLSSILYFDTNKKEFLYWPETERRKFISYDFRDDKPQFLIAKKEDGHYAIIHQKLGDLTILWEQVNINGDTISYRFNDTEHSIKFNQIIDAFNQSVAIITEKLQDNQIKPEAANDDNVGEAAKTNQEYGLPLDWILVTHGGTRPYKTFGNRREYQVSKPLNIRKKLHNGATVAIINTKKSYLLYGSIKNIKLSDKYYVLSEVKHRKLEKDFTIFQVTGHFYIGALIKDDTEETIYDTLAKTVPIKDKETVPPSTTAKTSKTKHTTHVRHHVAKQKKEHVEKPVPYIGALIKDDTEKTIYDTLIKTVPIKDKETVPLSTTAKTSNTKHTTHVCHRVSEPKKEHVEKPVPIRDADQSFEYGGARYKKGSLIPDQLLQRKRIYFKKEPGILFIKIDDSMVIQDSTPKRYRIEGVGGEYQEFMNNDNTRIRDAKDPIILIKETKPGQFIYYDLVQYESFEQMNGRKGRIIHFTLKSIS